MSDEPTPREEKRLNPIGRRGFDKVKVIGIVLLAVGALFQGGFFLVVKDMLAVWERQQNAERTERGRQHDDLMLFLETTSEQLGAILNVERAQAGERARPDPATFRQRRAKRAAEKAAALPAPQDIGGVKVP